MRNGFSAPGQGAHQNGFGRPQTGRDMARFPHTQGLPAFKKDSPTKDADGRPLPVTREECPFCSLRGGHRHQTSTKGDVEFHSCRKCKHLWATVTDKAQLVTPGMVHEMNRHVFGVTHTVVEHIEDEQ